MTKRLSQLLFIIITFLFVSNVYAQETTIKEACAYHEKEISAVMDFIISLDLVISNEINDEAGLDPDRLSTLLEQEKEAEAVLLKVSKIYHYLNCGKS